MPSTPNYVIRSRDIEVPAATLAEAIGILNDVHFHQLEASDLTLLDASGQAVPLLRDHGNVGVRLHGPAEEAIKALLVPALDQVSTALHPQPRPWEMRRSEWTAIGVAVWCAIGSIPGLDPETRGPWYRLADSAQRMIQDRLGYDYKGSADDGSGQRYGQHEVHVAHALAAGKPVPDEVIQDLLVAADRVGAPSFSRAVAERPFLRGKLGADQLSVLLSVYEHFDKLTITPANVDDLVEAVRGASSSPTNVEVDDRLYAAGLLPPLAVPLASAAQPAATASGNLAMELTERLDAARRSRQLKALQKSRADESISERRFERDITLARRPGSQHGSWANTVVEALEQRSIGQLLEIFDRSADHNVVSKRFARERFDLDMLNRNASERRAALFRFCGMDPLQQTAWEENAEAARTAHLQAEQAADAREAAIRSASYRQVRDSEGAVMSWKDFIDRRIAEGFVEVVTQKVGATPRYYLSNPSTRHSFALRTADGSLGYARIATADHAAAREVAWSAQRAETETETLECDAAAEEASPYERARG